MPVLHRPPGEALQGLPGGEPGEQLPHQVRLGGDHIPGRGVAGEPHPERRSAALRALPECPALPRGLPLDLGAGNGGLDAGEQAPAVGGQVRLAVRGHQPQPAFLGRVDPVLELPGLPGEPVQVPADQRVVRAHLVVGHQLVVRRPDLPPIAGADRVVDVLPGDGPPAAPGDLEAGLALTGDSELLAGRVQADP